MSVMGIMSEGSAWKAKKAMAPTRTPEPTARPENASVLAVSPATTFGSYEVTSLCMGTESMRPAP